MAVIATKEANLNESVPSKSVLT